MKDVTFNSKTDLADLMLGPLLPAKTKRRPMRLGAGLRLRCLLQLHILLEDRLHVSAQARLTSGSDALLWESCPARAC
jgi:hypothetical protein